MSKQIQIVLNEQTAKEYGFELLIPSHNIGSGLCTNAVYKKGGAYYFEGQSFIGTSEQIKKYIGEPNYLPDEWFEI